MDDNAAKIIIANQIINNNNQEEYSEYNILTGKNAIIVFPVLNENQEYEDNEEKEEENLYNILTTFSSEEKNMRYVKTADDSSLSSYS